jgi:hypothetical protein
LPSFFGQDDAADVVRHHRVGGVDAGVRWIEDDGLRRHHLGKDAMFHGNLR